MSVCSVYVSVGYTDTRGKKDEILISEQTQIL